MEKINVAILGASGAVGREMLKILEEYDIPVAKLLPLASARSAGGYVKFHGEDVLIEEATDESFAGMDYVLGEERYVQALRPGDSQERRGVYR